MPGTYVVKHSDSTVNAIEIPPLQQDTSTSLTFVGYRSPVYGEALWTNMLHMLEHFAAPAVTPTAERPGGGPRNPIIGQIWVDTTTSPGVPKVYNKQGIWEVIGAGLTISATQPANPGVVDPLYPPNLWFDTAHNALFYWNGSNWSGVNCTLVASQIEYNALYDALITAITTATAAGIGTIGMPGFGKITTTAGSSNAPPTTQQWSWLISTYRDFCGSIAAQNNVSGVSAADNKFWVDARASLQQAVVDAENFIWCPAGATSSLRGMSSYVSILDTMKNAAINALAWAATPDLSENGAVEFTMSSTTLVPGQQVTFAPIAPGATRWLWDFGNGVMSSLEVPPAIAYPNPGVYTVTLTASNSRGFGVASHTLTSYVKPISSFNTTGSLIGLPPLTVSFQDNSQNNPTSWRWTVTNYVTGSPVQLRDPQTPNNDLLLTDAGLPVYVWTEQNFSQRFTTNGVYTVTLVASNQAGESTNIATAQVITANTPVASFTYAPTSAPTLAVEQPPLTVQFTDTSTNAPNSWSWSFGDGATSTAQHPSHTYTTSGVFSVSLVATNVVGSGSSQAINAIATALTPVANFAYTGATGSPPLNVTFTDISTNYPTAWHWDFGDGTTSSVQNPPVHTYSSSINASTYVTPGSYSYTVPANVTALSYTYLTRNGDVTTTLAVTPGQVIPITIGAAGATSSIGGTTLPAYDTPVAMFDGNVDDELIQQWSTNTANAATYSGQQSSRSTLTAGALAVGLTYQEIKETFHGDLAASIAMFSTRASTLFTNPVAYFSAASGRHYVLIDSQPTAANGFIVTTHCGDGYADEGYYSFTVNLKHVTALKINAASYQFSVTLTTSNAAGSGTKTVQNIINTSFNANIVISTNQNNINIRDRLIALGWNGTNPVMGTLTINSGVVVGSALTSQYALITGGSFPSGSVFSIINNGYIVGKGGQGGGHGATGTAGLPGGAALYVYPTASKVTIVNNGTIGGGGGGGGKGSSGDRGDYSGGGGGGAGYGPGGTGAHGAGFPGGTGADGAAGTLTAGGAGGAGSWSGGIGGDGWGMNGGNGGALGAAGGAGGQWQAANQYIPGGAGGVAVIGNNNITWSVAGTRLGSVTP